VVPDDRLALLASEPAQTGIVLDVDGTLAPIVDRPEDARVPEGTRTELRRLVDRYALVACLSGRAGEDARRIVGVEGITYVGSHGLELEPQAAAWRSRLREFVATVPWPVEDKGLTVSFHYRGAPDESAARRRLEDIAARAEASGLHARFGRKVLELRPPVQADKGTAVRHLVAEHALRRAFFAGDDTTDLDAFRGLRESGLEFALCVAVGSTEGPPELAAAADLVVEGTEGVLELLRRL
jgi:trehalose 6-phosphate phosphatase